jgi:hypothetical protein
MSLANASVPSSSTHPITIDQDTDPTTPDTKKSGSAMYQAQKFMPPPRVVPRSPRTLKDFTIDSPSQNRGRSESSPASLASPSKAMPLPTPTSTTVATPPSTPLAPPTSTPLAIPPATPKPNLPMLALSVLTGDNISDASPLSSPTKLMRLRVSRRMSSRIQDKETGKGSASAPTTPRKTSESTRVQQPASPVQGAKSPTKVGSSEIPAQPSPRKLDQELMTLSNEIAGHWIKAIQGDGSGSKGMHKSGATVFLGQPTKIPLDQFSPELRKRLPASFNAATITHSVLITALYGQAFNRHSAAKVLLLTRRSVMQDYSDKKLMLSDLEARAESDPAAKERYKKNMEDRTRDCVQFMFGANASQSPGTFFSEELLSLWRTMDSQLIAMNLGKTERERLAYELVVSRMVLRTAKGNDAEAGQAIPTLFLATIKEASSKLFPQFCSKILEQFDKDRTAPTSTASTGAADLLNTAASSSSSSSTDSSSSSTSSVHSASSNNQSQ